MNDIMIQGNIKYYEISYKLIKRKQINTGKNYEIQRLFM